MKIKQTILLLLISISGSAQVVFDNPPVPIEFMDINYTINDNEVSIVWRTASERDNDFFTIEKSYNGIEWINAGIVKGSGTSMIINTYSFSVIENSRAYYRIFQTDFDGTEKYVSIIVVPESHDIPTKFYDLNGRSVDNDYGYRIVLSGSRLFKQYKM